jgi:hypothetical protein
MLPVKLFVEPSSGSAGGWALRWEGDTEQLGQGFPTCDSAKAAAGNFLGNVEIVTPPALPAVLCVLPQGSVESHLRALGIEPTVDATLPLFPASAGHVPAGT